jgi:hypothetical protein
VPYLVQEDLRLVWLVTGLYHVQEKLRLILVEYGSLFKDGRFYLLHVNTLFSLMNFAVNNQEKFQTNSVVQSSNTRKKYQIYRPVAKLSCFQKICNMLALNYSAATHVDSKSDK